MNKQQQLELNVLAAAAKAEFALDVLMEAVKAYRNNGIQGHLLQDTVELKPNNPTEHILERIASKTDSWH